MKRVLVVDDEPSLVELTCAVLEAEGYAVAGASNGREALERIAEARPDLILLDVMMPVLDGRETCRRLRSDPALRSIPVVFTTATPAALGPECDDDPVLHKPVRLETLLDTVEHAIGPPG